MSGIETASRQYAINAGAPSTAPREIGLIDRASGISGGLDALRSKLENLSDRITGQGQSPNAVASPNPCGLPGILSQAEDNLRRLHQIVDELSNKI